jgi:hypothetical protein
MRRLVGTTQRRPTVLTPTDPPSQTPLRGRDDRCDPVDLRLVALKRQVAIARALADEFERCLARGDVAPSAREQLARELARLGRGSLEAAAVLAAAGAHAETNADEESGVHVLSPLTP